MTGVIAAIGCLGLAACEPAEKELGARLPSIEPEAQVNSPGGGETLGPDVLGVRLGMTVDEANGVLGGRYGVDLRPAGPNQFRLPASALDSEGPGLFDTPLVGMGVMVEPEGERIAAIFAVVASLASEHSVCTPEIAEAVYGWAEAVTGDDQPDFNVAPMGEAVENFHRYEGDGFFVDTDMLDAGEGRGCVSLGVQLGRVGTVGSFDQRKAFERMISLAKDAEGFLTGHHGTYVPLCGMGPMATLTTRQMEYTLWSDENVAYMNVGRNVSPEPAELVESLGRRQHEIDQETWELDHYVIQLQNGDTVEMAIGQGKFGFVRKERLTELMSRCDGWSW